MEGWIALGFGAGYVALTFGAIWLAVRRIERKFAEAAQAIVAQRSRVTRNRLADRGRRPGYRPENIDQPPSGSGHIRLGLSRVQPGDRPRSR